MKLPTRRQLEKRGIKIVVGIPMERAIRDVPLLHFWNIARRGWELAPIIYGRTDANRNKMAHWVLHETDYTHICMLDSDHAHQEDIVEQLAIHVLRDPKKLVVAGLNFRRSAPYDPCAFRYGDDGRLHPPIEWDEGCIQVDAVGTGCILISRKVFEQVDPPWWAYGYNWAHINKYPSEDMFFSQQMRVNDIAIWCDTTTTSPHMGDMYINADSFRAFINANPETVSVVGKRN